ncbi:MAG: NapC/NirT family cytochrome c [Chloroflexi bacterium]|nr:NapC/NirT family cytochrome c [Chloroflexota bacterium]
MDQPPEATESVLRRHRDKLLFLMFAGAISIILLVIGGYQLVEFSDSTSFCGRLCHNVMYPEYATYQASPHSRVRCAECHVGSGADYLVRSKLSGIPQILATFAGDYERPIPTPVENLRPARETCEQCHRPERFAGDIVRTHTSFAPDEANTPRTDIRVLRVGGGEAGTARDIHWHIAATVFYLPLDQQRQEIIWVRVAGANGDTEFVDPARAAEITPERLAREARLMDCVDCHNRATHIFESPQTLIDRAFVEGTLDTALPYLKREGVRLLDPPASSLEEALEKVEDIRSFYQDNYPQVYAEREASVDRAVEVFKNVARLTTFPEMGVTWDTYPSNAGHQETDGCLRCHGKLEATSGPDKGQKIDASCESCHYFQLPQ